MKDEKERIPSSEKLPGEGFETETHNPPSLVRKSGIHLPLGEREEYFHRPLEDVLTGLFTNPTTAPGGRVRDIAGSIDCGNETRAVPRTSLDISEERDFLLSVLKDK